MKYATFNVLADAYIGYGDYSHTTPELLHPGARQPHIVRQINNLGADIIGLQEADQSLVEVFEGDKRWQTFWLPKGRNKPDGCLTLVDKSVDITEYRPNSYDDDSGHVFQIIQIGMLAVANTHIKWARVDDVQHIGVSQTKQLLKALSSHELALILADCNDQPDGPVRTLVQEAGFVDVGGDIPTAIVNKELVALDLLATRGVEGHLISTDYDLASAPNTKCASDHIPVVADLDDSHLL